MQASAPDNWERTDGLYIEKSSTRTTFSLGFDAKVGGSGFRESAMMDVIEGCVRACVRTSWPMKPVVPVRMTFIALDIM
jgi:hypothetical protein